MLVTIAQSDVLCQVSSEINISLTSQDHVATSSLNVEFCGCSRTLIIVKGALQLGGGGTGSGKQCREGNDDHHDCTPMPCCGECHRGGKGS